MRETIDAGARPPDQPDWLRREIENWVSERIIRREQAQMILARYGLFEGESPRSLKQIQIVHLVSVAGALLVGIGVLVVVGANWDAIPRVARLAVLILATLAFYAGGYWIGYERKTYPGVGKALILVGSLVWVSSIFLVAQMFHLGSGGDPEYSKGLVYGFIGLIPLAYVLRSPLQLALALFVGTLWLVLGWPSGDVLNAFGPPWLFLKLLAIGPLLYIIGLAHRLYEVDEKLAPAYTKYGIAAASLGLYILSFNGLLDFPRWELDQAPWFGFGVIIAVTIAGAAVVAWLSLRAKGLARERTGPAEALACIAIAAIAAVLPMMAHAEPATYPYPHTDWESLIVTNGALLALEIGCIWVGWSRAQTGLINWGLTLFFIHLMTRYFDLFAEMLPTGTAFIGAGVLLLLAGFGLERQRRHLIQTMPPAPESRPPGDLPGTLPEGGMA